jgi:hypothetical protein
MGRLEQRLAASGEFTDAESDANTGCAGGPE